MKKKSGNKYLMYAGGAVYSLPDKKYVFTINDKSAVDFLLGTSFSGTGGRTTFDRLMEEREDGIARFVAEAKQAARENANDIETIELVPCEHKWKFIESNSEMYTFFCSRCLEIAHKEKTPHP